MINKLNAGKQEKQRRASGLMLLLILCSSLSLGTRAVKAQEEIPPGGEGSGGNPTAPLPLGSVPVLGADPLRRLTLGGAAAANASVTEVPVEGQIFDYALRIETRVATAADTQITLAASSTSAVAAGDTLFIRFYARTLSTSSAGGTGRVRLTFPAAFGTPIFSGSVAEGWKVVVLPVPARLAYAANTMSVAFNVGGTGPQTIEIGGFEFVNLRRLYLTHQLPYRTGNYEGREDDAPWRAAAQRRIEQHRKGDLRVVVVNRDGTPIPDASVQVAMKRHAYNFGTAISGGALLPPTPNDNTFRYKSNLARYFNAGGPENDLKWRNWENPTSRQRGINTVLWLREKGMEARGHVLVWPSWSNSPDSLKREYDTLLASEGLEAANDRLRQRVLDHVREEAGHPDLKGNISEWDVINETIANTDFQRILGKSILVDIFHAAREADPNARLYINENSVELLTSSKTQAYLNEIRYLLDNGAPLGGIGIQGHIGTGSIPSYIANLDRYAQFGLPIRITEFDTVTPDEEVQADFTRDFLTATFANPATVGFQMWGFWDGAQWLYDAPLFYRGTSLVPALNWVLKPSGAAYRDLVFGTWWTNAQGATANDGTYAARGFLGDYEVTVSTANGTKVVPVTLVKEGTEVVVVTPDTED